MDLLKKNSNVDSYNFVNTFFEKTKYIEMKLNQAQVQANMTFYVDLISM